MSDISNLFCSTGKESLIYRQGDHVIKVAKPGYENIIKRSFQIGKVMQDCPGFVKTRDLVANRDIGNRIVEITNRDLFEKDNQVSVSYDYISDLTLKQAIENGILFIDFLTIFLQILFYLEIAQRSHSFCHYDLHTENILLKKVDRFSYTINLDLYSYVITTDYLPIIIDFGMSSVRNKTELIGSEEFERYNVFKYGIPGVDMYKLLFHVYANSQNNMGELQSKIASLFLFYGPHDPYSLLSKPVSKIPEISKQFLKEASTSAVATFIPIDFIEWILQTYPVPNIVISSRKIYTPSPTNVTSHIKADIQSYFMAVYLGKILETDCKPDTSLIRKDKRILQGYTKLKVPIESSVRDLAGNILVLKETSKNSKKLICEFRKVFQFTEKFKPYLQYLFIIYEINLCETYSTFVSKFLISKQFQLYQKIYRLVERVQRWCQVLEAKK